MNETKAFALSDIDHALFYLRGAAAIVNALGSASEMVPEDHEAAHRAASEMIYAVIDGLAELK